VRRFEGKTALVTGAGRGIGEGVARRLASEGAAVCVVDIDGARAEEVAASLGAGSFALAADLSVRAEAETVVPAAWERFGALDVLVNNAGITRDAMLHKMSDEQWDAVIALNLTAVFVLTRAAATRMRERGSGRIVNISSTSANGNAGQANYAAAKAGVIGITKTAAKELAGKGVTVNAVAPGFIDTEMTRSMPPEVYEAARSRVPVGRAGTPEDVAALIAYLASDEASYITGELLYVRGGWI
jgi:3-oxoacyl-[acyl-carrier protein] reductase/2-hydroxycyclohexanecarboxyl-CoA dehydrogenase